MNPNAELICPPCPISQQESNWPLLAVSKGFFEGAMIKGNTTSSTSATTGLTSNITTKLAANLHIDETNASGGDWADDEVQVELDQDDMNADHLHGNTDEQGEGWGDTDLELPADLVRSSLDVRRTEEKSLRSLSLFTRKEQSVVEPLVTTVTPADTLLLLVKVNLWFKRGLKTRSCPSITFSVAPSNQPCVYCTIKLASFRLKNSNPSSFKSILDHEQHSLAFHRYRLSMPIH